MADSTPPMRVYRMVKQAQCDCPACAAAPVARTGDPLSNAFAASNPSNPISKRMSDGSPV